MAVVLIPAFGVLLFVSILMFIGLVCKVVELLKKEKGE